MQFRLSHQGCSHVLVVHGLNRVLADRVEVADFNCLIDNAGVGERMQRVRFGDLHVDHGLWGELAVCYEVCACGEGIEYWCVLAGTVYGDILGDFN